MQDQGPGRVGVWGEPASCVIDSHLFAGPSRGGRGKGPLWEFFRKGTNLIREDSTLMTYWLFQGSFSSRYHHIVDRFQHENPGETYTFCVWQGGRVRELTPSQLSLSKALLSGAPGRGLCKDGIQALIYNAPDSRHLLPIQTASPLQR